MPSKNTEPESVKETVEETLDEKVERLWAEHEAAVNATIDGFQSRIDHLEESPEHRRYCSVPENKAR